MLAWGWNLIKKIMLLGLSQYGGRSRKGKSENRKFSLRGGGKHPAGVTSELSCSLCSQRSRLCFRLHIPCLRNALGQGAGGFPSSSSDSSSHIQLSALVASGWRAGGHRTAHPQEDAACAPGPREATSSYPEIPFPPHPYPGLTALVCLHMLLSTACSELLKKKPFLRGKNSLYYKKIVTSRSSRISKKHLRFLQEVNPKSLCRTFLTTISRNSAPKFTYYNRHKTVQK